MRIDHSIISFSRRSLILLCQIICVITCSCNAIIQQKIVTSDIVWELEIFIDKGYSLEKVNDNDLNIVESNDNMQPQKYFFLFKQEDKLKALFFREKLLAAGAIEVKLTRKSDD
ncbi:MAG: hypothetical protein WC622_03525 [Pedobacter sp.]|jgi:hypothetical protein|uniref:hypothetical protein n=1 Tax=Pedobacter sp. TaxID=1411316 RepID=UPI0035665653